MKDQTQNPINAQDQENTTLDIAPADESAIPSLVGVFGRTQSNNMPAPYCSFRPVTAPEKARLYRAMTNPDRRLSDCINEVIRLVDVFVEWVEMTDPNSGEVSVAPRCVLFDADGRTYAAVSRGIVNSLERLAMVYGAPHWDEPISVRIRQVQNGARRFYTLDIAD